MIEYLITAAGVILMAIVSYLLVPLIKKAGAALTAQIEERTKSEKLASAMQQATEIVAQVVAATAQTYVDDLKKSGSFDADAQVQALTMAKDAALALISDETKNIIEENHKSFADWLVSAIEAAVAKNKEGKQ